MKVPKKSRLSPIDALRRIRAICYDRRMSAAARLTVIAIVIHARDATGIARPGITKLCKDLGVHQRAAKEALGNKGNKRSKKKPKKGKANPHHLVAVRRGRHGIRRYRVLPGPQSNNSSPGSPSQVRHPRFASEANELATDKTPSSTAKTAKTPSATALKRRNWLYKHLWSDGGFRCRTEEPDNDYEVLLRGKGHDQVLDRIAERLLEQKHLRRCPIQKILDEVILAAMNLVEDGHWHYPLYFFDLLDPRLWNGYLKTKKGK